jgi:hypothetical protein
MCIAQRYDPNQSCRPYRPTDKIVRELPGQFAIVAAGGALIIGIVIAI